MNDFLALAIRHADEALAILKRFDRASKFAADDLYQAWDLLSTASENVREAARKTWPRDPRG